MPYTQVYQPLNILPFWIYCSLDFTIQIYICISIFAHFSELFGNELQTSCTFTLKYFSVYILKIKNNFFHNHSTTKKIRKFYIDTMTVTLNPYSNVTSYSNNACYNVFFPFPDLQSNLESCIEFSLHVSLVPCGTNLWRPLSLSLSSMTLAFSKSTNRVFSRMFKNLSMSVVSSYLSHFIQI